MPGAAGPSVLVLGTTLAWAGLAGIEALAAVSVTASAKSDGNDNRCRSSSVRLTSPVINVSVWSAIQPAEAML